MPYKVFIIIFKEQFTRQPEFFAVNMAQWVEVRLVWLR